MALSYEEGKKVFLKTILILAAITLIEVFIALLGKGYLIKDFELPGMLVGGVMIILSAYKAFLIVFEFMHVKYEVKGLMRSILLPTILLVWAIIAFLWDSSYWKDRRDSDGVEVKFDRPEDDATYLMEDGHKDHHEDDHH